MASSRSEENVNLHYFTNWWCQSYGETCNFLDIFCKSNLADVIANVYYLYMQSICSKYGVQVHFKGGQTIKSLLMAPKDNDPITSKSGVIYRYQCNEQGCGEEYIGESGRTFAERFKEHQKPPSPIFDHCNTSGHQININKFTIVGREDQNLIRAIKEAILYKGQ